MALINDLLCDDEPMPHRTITQEAPVLIIDLGIGVMGFLLYIGWGQFTKTRMPRTTIKILALVWVGIALFGVPCRRPSL